MKLTYDYTYKATNVIFMIHQTIRTDNLASSSFSKGKLVHYYTSLQCLLQDEVEASSIDISDKHVLLIYITCLTENNFHTRRIHC